MRVIGTVLCPVLGWVFHLICSGTQPALAQNLTTPSQWLAGQRPPTFRKGHSLPPITRYGWKLPVPLRILLADKWGYALEFGGYATFRRIERALLNPVSKDGQILALAAKNPERYKLAVILPRNMPKQVPPSAWVRDRNGNRLRPARWSPAAPDAAIAALAEERAAPMRLLATAIRPAIVLNGGEYGIGELGHNLKFWRQDPSVVAARGRQPWFEFISERKAIEQTAIREAVEAAIGKPFLYVYYTAGGGPHTKRDWRWKQWQFDYAHMRGVGTYPSNGFYYKQFNNGWLNGGGKGDLLTQALNAKAIEFAAGDHHSYDWISGGWHGRTAGLETAGGTVVIDHNPVRMSDIASYTGYIKCLYAAGTLGANAGYYSFPTGGFKRLFNAASPPHWLLQLMALSRVHGLFSYLEPFVRNSYLVPTTNRHRWGEHPAYEFRTGDANLRVLARQHKTRPAWLVVAWSGDGIPRNGRVKLPGSTVVEVAGTKSGRVYLVRNGQRLVAINEENVAGLAEKYPDLFGPHRQN